jgi:outer membrane protein OmpA-like peptidoglycan-associated protein
MKSLVALPLLLLTTTAVAKPSYTVGVGGGVLVTDPLEVLGPGLNIVPRAGIFFNDSIGLELEAGFASGTTRVGEFSHSTVTPRLSLLGKLWNRGPKKDDGSYGDPPFIHPTVGAGFGFWYKSTNDPNMDLGSTYNYNDVDFLATAGPGLMVPLGILHLRTDLRWTLSLGSENYQNRGDQFINWEWTAGLGLTFGGSKDRDKDGVLDADDACPNDPEDLDRFEDDDGCPDKDNDEDGLADTEDKCPTDAEDEDDFEDDDGCPDPDNDNDEVLDEEDECPEEPGSVSGKGCPDEDGDTVVDSEDECVDEAGSVEAFGCLDDDEDRVPNWRDECPEEAAPAKANPKLSNGCPVRVYVTKEAITITDKIFFDTGKATIKKESNALLDEIAGTLQKYDFIKKVSIEGHTDNTGTKEGNQKLSEERAASVMAYLVEKGIAEDRLTSKGFGQDKPKVDGEEADTDEGRALNRRVEFNITEQEERKTKVLRPRLDLGALTAESVEALKEMIDGLTVKSAKLPQPDLVPGEHSCEVWTVIESDGTVLKAKVSECYGLARYAARGTLKSWVFEPYEVDGEAKRIAARFVVDFKDGNLAVEHDAKNLRVLEPEPEEEGEDEEAGDDAEDEGEE